MPKIEEKILKAQNNAKVRRIGNILEGRLGVRLTNAKDRAAALDFCKVIVTEVKVAEKALAKRAKEIAKQKAAKK